MVTEGEIIDAIKDLWEPDHWMESNAVPEQAWDDVRQASVRPRTMEILARELGIPMEEITKSGGNSRIMKVYNKDSFGEDGK